MPPGTLSSTGHRTGLTTQINIHPEHSDTRLQEGQYESSVPAVRDRVVQAAVKIVLEPVFEADFLPCSFGFRPKRAAHDGLQVLLDESFRGDLWVAETDVADCFGAIPHSGLMSAVEERISDRRLLALLRAFLRAGVMEHGSVRRPVTGTAQGGVISPLMCNVYLHRLDRAWRGAYGTLVRYADLCRARHHSRLRRGPGYADLSVGCPGQGGERVPVVGIILRVYAELGISRLMPRPGLCRPVSGALVRAVSGFPLSA